jgi:hypothetical protein
MEIKDLVRVLKAVENLSSGTTFTMSNDDFETIEWKSNGNLPPTLDQLFAEIERLKQHEIAITENAKTAKKTAETKLIALGLDADDLKALGL